MKNTLGSRPKPELQAGEARVLLASILLLGLAIVSCPPLFADFIHLKNGQKLEGKVIKKTQTTVTLEVPGGTVEFNKDEISRIEKAAEKAPAEKTKPAEPVEDLKKAELFSTPSQWVKLPVSKEVVGAAYFFNTHPEQDKALKVFVRFFKVPNQSALKWARDETKSLDARRIQIISKPAKVLIKDQKWVKLVSEARLDIQGVSQTLRNEQYFIESTTDDTLVEAALMGKKELFQPSIQEEFIRFLSTIPLDAKAAQLQWVEMPFNQSPPYVDKRLGIRVDGPRGWYRVTSEKAEAAYLKYYGEAEKAHLFNPMFEVRVYPKENWKSAIGALKDYVQHIDPKNFLKNPEEMPANGKTWAVCVYQIATYLGKEARFVNRKVYLLLYKDTLIFLQLTTVPEEYDQDSRLTDEVVSKAQLGK